MILKSKNPNSKMPIASNFTSVYSKEWEINFTQCYPNGNLKLPELCNLLQLTAASHSELGGISFSDMQEFHQAWVLSRMRVEIVAMPKWKDTIIIKTWIISFEKSRSVRAFEVTIKDQKVIGCETLWFVFNTQSRRPEALTLPNEHFELFPDEKSTLEDVKKINIPENLNIKSIQIVKLSDLDIVNHVNNVKYLEWCFDFADVKLLLKNQLKSFDMNFNVELVLGEEISIQEFSNSEKTIFSILKNEKPCFALELNWNK